MKKNALPSINLKKILLLFTSVVVLVTVVLLIALTNSSDEIYKPDISSDLTGNETVTDVAIYVFDGEGMIVVSIGNEPAYLIDGWLSNWDQSLTGCRAAVLSDFNPEEGGTLWFIDDTGSSLIAHGVFLAIMSDSGDGVAFLTEVDIDDNSATLSLYNATTGAVNKITENFALRTGSEGISLSPDGQSVGFIQGTDISALDTIGYISINGGEPIPLGKNTRPLAIADNGRFTYYAHLTGTGDERFWTLVVKSDEGNTELVNNWSWSELILNIDFSEALFFDNDRVYLSRDGRQGEAVGVTGLRDIIIPHGTPTINRIDPVTVLGTPSFDNIALVGQDAFIHIGEGHEIAEISGLHDTVYTAMMTGDGNWLLYVDDSRHVIRINPSRPDDGQSEHGEYVSDIRASNDGSTIYYLDHYMQLWTVRNLSEHELIANNVSPHFFVPSHNGDRVFFLVDHCWEMGGTLYTSVNGGEAARIESGLNVRNILTTPSGAFFVTTEGVLYRSGIDGIFSLFASEINTWGMW